MENVKVNCSSIEISNSNRICLIAGPCQLETEQHAMDMAGKIKEITDKFKIGFIYKTSFDKANRTSLKGKSKIRDIYKSRLIKERHRHRYEVDISYKEKFEKKGLIFSGLSPDHKLPEIIELKNHPWFIGVQFHPEFKSRPLNPHPLFSSFIKAAKNHR